MARSYNRGRRSTAPRRRLFWARRQSLLQFTETNQATPQNLLGPFQEAYGADLFGFTVTRIVGHYTWWTADDQTTATTYNFSVGIRTDEQEQAAGDTDTRQQQQIPANSPHDDWMYVRNNLGIASGTGAPEEVEQSALNRIELDLKSQRRLDELGQSLYIYAGLNDYPGVDVWAWYDLNILCKRP